MSRLTVWGASLGAVVLASAGIAPAVAAGSQSAGSVATYVVQSQPGDVRGVTGEIAGSGGHVVRTLPALDPQDIQPKAELRLAQRAHAVLDGTAEGRRDARELGIRFLITDPTCTDARGRPLSPPGVGSPVYASDRLVVLELRRRS